jgi:hypothetical protein
MAARAKTTKKSYGEHRQNAKKRNILFLLTYDQWLEIWTASKHLHERGPRRNQYVMARFGDKGPYAVGNVDIVTAEENSRANGLGKRHTAETKAKIAAANRGKRHTAETKARWSIARRGRRLTDETKARMSIAQLGNKKWLGKRHTVETKERIAAAQRKRHAARRRAATVLGE